MLAELNEAARAGQNLVTEASVAEAESWRQQRATLLEDSVSRLDERLTAADSDFGPVAADVTAGQQALMQDLELDTLLSAMADRDQFLYLVARTALLASLPDVETITYRQQVLADCLEHPDLVRELYDLAVAAIAGEKRPYGSWFFPKSPDAILRRSVEVLQIFAGYLRLEPGEPLPTSLGADVYRQVFGAL